LFCALHRNSRTASPWHHLISIRFLAAKWFIFCVVLFNNIRYWVKCIRTVWRYQKDNQNVVYPRSIHKTMTEIKDKRWLFSPGPPVSSSYKAYRHGIVESGVKHHKKPTWKIILLLWSCQITICKLWKKWKLNEAVGRGQYLFLRSMKTHIERYKLLYLYYCMISKWRWIGVDMNLIDTKDCQ
jgi:hypothetical protein